MTRGGLLFEFYGLSACAGGEALEFFEVVVFRLEGDEVDHALLTLLQGSIEDLFDVTPGDVVDVSCRFPLEAAVRDDIENVGFHLGGEFKNADEPFGV